MRLCSSRTHLKNSIKLKQARRNTKKKQYWNEHEEHLPPPLPPQLLPAQQGLEGAVCCSAAVWWSAVCWRAVWWRAVMWCSARSQKRHSPALDTLHCTRCHLAVQHLTLFCSTTLKYLSFFCSELHQMHQTRLLSSGVYFVWFNCKIWPQYFFRSVTHSGVTSCDWWCSYYASFLGLTILLTTRSPPLPPVEWVSG